jgi:hypothetical protein
MQRSANRHSGNDSPKDSRFPWGSNNPTRLQRLIVAAIVAGIAVTIIVLKYHLNSGYRSDFGEVWFGARQMLDGIDPYPLVGPGKVYSWQWGLLYPGTALVVAIPFAILPQAPAAVLFVGVCTFLLAYGITRDSWHLMPIFCTEAFVASAALAQWSLLLTAALFIPALAAIASVKPQSGVAVVASTSSKGLLFSAIGTCALLIISLLFLPKWPAEWLQGIRSTPHMSPPIMRFGGFIVLLSLLKWRRKEAWILLATACVPQAWGWYTILPVLTIAGTFREAGALALLSTGGSLIGPFIVRSWITSSASFYSVVGGVLIVSTYIPATLMLLRRPNQGEPPGWLHYFVAMLKPNSSPPRQGDGIV